MGTRTNIAPHAQAAISPDTTVAEAVAAVRNLLESHRRNPGKGVGTLWAVAQSISRAAVLRELAGSGIAEVVAAALANKHAPQDVLAAAAKDRRAE